MKKTILTLLLTLAMLASFSLAVSASGDGSSFENAIPLTPQPGDERGKPLDGYTPVVFTLEHFDRGVYFVFTTAGASHHTLHWKGALRFDIYDSRQNLIEENFRGSFEAGARETYYVRVSFVGGEQFFNQNAPFTEEIGVLEFTPESVFLGELGIWGIIITLGIPFVFVILIAFPYKRYMLRKYDFNPMGKPFWYSMILIMVGVCMMWFEVGTKYWVSESGIFAPGWSSSLWFYFALAMPGFLIMTIKLLTKTRNPIMLVINTLLMLGFYFLMGWVAAMLFLVFVIIMIFLVIFGGGLPAALRGGGRGGGGTRTCSKCGMALGSALSCPGCGVNNRG